MAAPEGVQNSDPPLYGYYSAKHETWRGYSIYERRDYPGNTAKVTHVTNNPSINAYEFPDKVFVGIVGKMISNHRIDRGMR